MDLIRALQTRIAPDVFTPLGVYDGRKNFFSARKLPLGPDDLREVRISIRLFSVWHHTTLTDSLPQFDVTLESADEAPKGKGPKVYKIRFNLVAQINPE